MKHTPKTVAAITHTEAKRRNIPTAEMQAVVDDATEAPVQAAKATVWGVAAVILAGCDNAMTNNGTTDNGGEVDILQI